MTNAIVKTKQFLIHTSVERDTRIEKGQIE